MLQLSFVSSCTRPLIILLNSMLIPVISANVILAGSFQVALFPRRTGHNVFHTLIMAKKETVVLRFIMNFTDSSC